MAVKCNPDRVTVKELIDLLVKREVVGHEQTVDEVHIRHLPGTPDFFPVGRPELDDPVRITQGKRQGGTVEIDNHAGDPGIDICGYPVLVAENDTGQGIAIIPQLLLGKKQERADRIRDFCPTMGDGYQERVALFHQYQQRDIGRDILLTFGCRHRQGRISFSHLLNKRSCLLSTVQPHRPDGSPSPIPTYGCTVTREPARRYSLLFL
jgi:hypothetical protein